MNIKMIAATLTMFGAAMAMATTSVMDVKVQPRSPWNGLVDVEYTLVCDDPEAEVYVNPVGYDGDRGITLFPSAFTGDAMEGPVKAGKHTLVWDARKDFGYSFSCANFQLKFYAGKHLAPYVIIDLSGGYQAEHWPVRYSAKGPDLSSDVCRTTELWMRLIPPGSFMMGSPEGEIGRDGGEPLHRVTLTKPFYMGVFEVTQGQWSRVTGDTGVYCGYFCNATNSACRPFECNSRGYRYIRGTYDKFAPDGHDVEGDSFMARLRMKTGLNGFDLPSEAQWEYACRAGTLTALNNGKNLNSPDGGENLAEVARYCGNGYNNMAYDSKSVAVGTATVGCYKPNALGLYDMHGNVTEFCRDVGSTKLTMRDVIDPPIGMEYSGDAWSNTVWRAGRGGNWLQEAWKCRSAERNWHYNANFIGSTFNYMGFRLYSDASF